MIRKQITKSLYTLFDMLNRGRLKYHYDQAKKYNISSKSRTEELHRHLKRWNFNPELEKNILMSKKDIIESSKLIKTNDVHSWAYTGGSFGEPLKVPYSKERNFIRTATFRYFNEIAGYELGSSFAIIRAKKKSRIAKFLRNETIVIPSNVSENKLIQDIERLGSNKITTLMGYPTVMYEIALLLKKKPELLFKLNIKSLISTSEMLEEVKRKFTYEVFGCSFIDRYSNEEVGLIAQQYKYNSDYHVNQYGVYVEVVNPDTLAPVKSGEEGRVVVTDIYNDLVPIIRYDTGDIAIAGEYLNGHLQTIKKIIGRTSDQLQDTHGNPISSLSLGPLIYKPLAEAEYNIQFQLVQENENIYLLRLKIQEGNFEKRVKQEILKNLRVKLGPDSNINFSFVKDIPPMPSGKRPVYINKLKINRVR